MTQECGHNFSEMREHALLDGGRFLRKDRKRTGRNRPATGLRYRRELSPTRDVGSGEQRRTGGGVDASFTAGLGAHGDRCPRTSRDTQP